MCRVSLLCRKRLVQSRLNRDWLMINKLRYQITLYKYLDRFAIELLSIAVFYDSLMYIYVCKHVPNYWTPTQVIFSGTPVKPRTHGENMWKCKKNLPYLPPTFLTCRYCIGEYDNRVSNIFTEGGVVAGTYGRRSWMWGTGVFCSNFFNQWILLLLHDFKQIHLINLP